MTDASSHWRSWLPLPWVVALAVGLVLAGMRVLGVLDPAILAHAAFNASMNTFIFAALW